MAKQRRAVMRNVFLSGSNIYLRALDISDLNGGYLNWLNDSDVCAYNSHHVFPYSREKAEKYISRINESSTDLVLAMVVKENNRHIGNISLQNINFINRNAEFAILLGEQEYWGKGFSKEASLLIVKHGFNEFNLNRIYCGTSEFNIPMQRLAVYLGMQEEGRRREAQFKHGRYNDLIEYGVLYKDFFKIFGGED